MNKFYNRVYLCTQHIDKIDCKLFDSFESADAYKNSTIKTKDTNETNTVFPVYNIVSTLIPMYVFTPKFFDKPILKYELANMLNVKISYSTVDYYDEDDDDEDDDEDDEYDDEYDDDKRR